MKNDDKEVIDFLYENNSFEQDLQSINGLVKIRVSTNDPSRLEVGKVLKKYMIIVWSIEDYPRLITCAGSEELSPVENFAKDKLYSFSKGERFYPDNFIPTLRECSEAGFSESQFTERYYIVKPFKVKLVRDDSIISDRKRIINGLISEV